MTKKKSRRHFLKKISETALAVSILPISAQAFNSQKILLERQPGASDNSTIRVGFIGMGIMGFNNAHAVKNIPGAKIVAACDLYEGRLKRTKEVFGADIFTTMDYQDVLKRDDIDAVVVSTTDHWHDKISIDAMRKGKAVYCEKPMVHHIEEGIEVINVQKETKKVFQVGSQRVSSIIYKKARELFAAGEIGDLVLAESWADRFSALGAWQYSIPTDASVQTIDWQRFLGDAPETPFDPKRFFWWRNYRDYGTGVAGDLFVHLFSGLHLIIDSYGPERIFATGGIRYWKDGRDVPDVMIGSYDYPATKTHPAFNLQLRVNFVASGGGSEKLRLVGTKGVLTINNNSLFVEYNSLDEAPGYGGWDSFNTFSNEQQKDYEAWYNKTYPSSEKQQHIANILEFTAPEGYNAHDEHVKNFLDAVRNGTKVVEDATFGLRAAGAALASNMSYFQKKVILWDPVNMKVV